MVIFKNHVPEDFWEKNTYYRRAEMLYAFTVGIKMDEEREYALHMFDGEVEQIRSGSSHIPKWYKQYQGQS